MRKQWSFLTVLILFLICGSLNATDPASVWDLEELKNCPKADWHPVVEKNVKDDKGIEKTITTRRVYYESVPFNGKPTRVMAFYSRPKAEGQYPGIVLVHGGGGTAFSHWTQIWAARGYTAIAMDLSGNEVISEESTEGNSPRKRLADGGPDQADTVKFRDFTSDPNDYKNFWTYHAVAAIMKAHSLLISLPETDKTRTAATGISWGGYLTSMISGIDDRFKVVVPVYGCGQILEGVWAPWTKRKSAEQCQRWNELFDPNSYIDQAKCRLFFVDGTDDFAYPLEITRSSWEKVPQADVRLEVAMLHSHQHGWLPKEIAAYIDSVLQGTVPPPCLTSIVHSKNAEGKNIFSAKAKYNTQPVSGKLWYTTDPGGFANLPNGQYQWQIRKWESVPAEINGSTIQATLPESVTQRPVRVFLEATDANGLTGSTHFLML